MWNKLNPEVTTIIRSARGISMSPSLPKLYLKGPFLRYDYFLVKYYVPVFCDLTFCYVILMFVLCVSFGGCSYNCIAPVVMFVVVAVAN